jgi:hypothetical protein
MNEDTGGDTHVNGSLAGFFAPAIIAGLLITAILTMHSL